MPNWNSCTFIGHLGRDPEVRYAQSGTAITSCVIAVNYGYGDKKDSIWIDLTVFGKTGENFGQWCQKGDAVCVQGELGEDKWQDRTTGEDRKKLVLKVRDWTKVSGKRASGGGEGHQRKPKEAPVPVQTEEEMDNIPF